jgi:hypothetical protein
MIMPPEVRIELAVLHCPDHPYLTINRQRIVGRPLRRWIKWLTGCLRMALLATNDHADMRMRMQRRNARYSAMASASCGGAAEDAVAGQVPEAR